MKMWRDWGPHTLLVGLKNGAAALENGLVVSQKVTHRVTM